MTSRWKMWGDDPIPPPPLEQDDDPLPVLAQAVQSDPPHRVEEDWEGARDDRDVIVENERERRQGWRALLQ